MPTEQVSIPDHLAEFIRGVIASGQYQDIDEVIRVSVHLLEERLANEQAQKEKLRTMLEDAKAGGVSERTAREVWEAVESRYREKNA